MRVLFFNLCQVGQGLALPSGSREMTIFGCKCNHQTLCGDILSNLLFADAFHVSSLALLWRFFHKHPMSEIKQSPGWLRPAVEYGPIAAFFTAYYMADLFAATAAIMVATALALALSYIVERRIPMTPLISAGIVGIFGGLTLWLQDETFIKMKPTIIQAIFGTILIAGLLTKRLFLKSLMGSVWHITDEGWRALTVRFSLYFFLMGALNEAVWRTQSTDVWVNFKVFGLMGLTFVFIMTQLPLLKRYAIEDDSAQ